MATKNQIKRAKLILDIKDMSFKQTVDELEKMRKKTSEYGRCPAVIIEYWLEKATEENTTMHRWIMRQFMVEPPPRPKRLHDEHQRPIQEVFKLDK
jgi:hypothetical protein